jgi:hypothetical protein
MTISTFVLVAAEIKPAEEVTRPVKALVQEVELVSVKEAMLQVSAPVLELEVLRLPAMVMLQGRVQALVLESAKGVKVE